MTGDPPPIGAGRLALAAATRGFLPESEARALHAAAYRAAAVGPLLEIGSYCGKSAIYLGAAAEAAGTVLFSIDHHRGSEEHQAGHEYHDPDLVDPAGRVDTLPCFRATIAAADLEASVVGVLGTSAVVAAHWRTPLGLVFIDGGHSLAAAQADLEGWAPHVAPGGILAIHDVFPNPADGGRPPYEIYLAALASGRFEDLLEVGSLRLLVRRSQPKQG